MPEWAYLALIYAALLGVALGRVAAKQLAQAQAMARMLAVEREMKRTATRVRIAADRGTQVTLGVGKRVLDLFELRAFALELHADGDRIAIEPGTTLHVVAASVTIDGLGVARVPADTALLCHLPQRRDGDPDVRALPVGEVVFLFDDGAQLFARVRFTREAAWLRAALLVIVPALVVAAIAFDGPNSAWNAPAVLGIVFLLIDQVLARGLLTWALCTRPRDPDAWSVQESPE
jgi:hypothetical protein